MAVLEATVRGRKVREHFTDCTVWGKDWGVRSRTQILTAHSAETPIKKGYAVSVTQNWLNLPHVQASINWFAGIKTMVKSVPVDNGAWHASWANQISVGYEIVGYAAYSAAQWTTDDAREAIEREAMQMARDSIRYNIPVVWLSDAQVNSIKYGNTTIKGFAKHAQIDPATRTDPGRNFPYELLLQRVRAHRATLLGKVIEVASTESEKEKDPMPRNYYNRCTQKQSIKRKRWTTLKATKQGYISIIHGNQANMSINYATVHTPNLPTSGEMLLRFVVVDYNKGKPTKVYRHHEYIDVPGTGGSTKARIVQPSSLPKGSNYRLRLQVFSSHDIDITDVHIDSLTWKD